MARLEQAIKEGLYDMAPNPAPYNLPNRFPRDTIPLGKRGIARARSTQVSYLADLNFGYLGLSIIFATENRLGMFVAPMFFGAQRVGAALSGTVSVVISQAFRMQVPRVATGRIVALVADSESWRNSAVGENPCDSMSKKRLAPNLEPTVTVNRPSRLPFPAFIGIASVNLVLESSGLLRSERRDATICATHDDPLSGRCARTACGQPAGRSLRVDHARAAA